MDIRQIVALRPLLKAPAPPLAFSGVQCDSRRIQPGQLFVAINGSREDGARYAQAACSRGAVGVVAETPVRGLTVPVIEVTDARQALGILADEAAGHPSGKLALYGITGTNGKTTTAWILAELLKAGGRRTGLITTVQTEYGERTIPSARTTPDACALQTILKEMVDEGCNAAVMEVSSHALDQQRIAALRFAGAVFTHLTRDHLDYHHTFEAYFAAKQKLFLQLSRTNPGAPAVTFLDAPYGPEMTAFIKMLPLRGITCGFETPADLNATDIQVATEGSRFTLTDRRTGASQRLAL
ncbi:MAG: UDP-N-acetylmuramoyl-L-alanyl-D-glutamate--2,6-diaminopimelate ligase, partial [Kiritimatiellae bacterium]|nr:UDP-N-acetylmuramoyl-L-alanyl-D-glutamate--2,6-diaminopimelate ligase [Kiritimatiellia bacterium]